MELVLRRDVDLQAKNDLFICCCARGDHFWKRFILRLKLLFLGGGGAPHGTEWITMVFHPVYFGVGGLWKFIRNGIALHLPPPRRWNISSIMRAEFTPAGQAFDELIYGEGDLAPENIFHILKYRATPAYAKYFEDKNIPMFFPRI